MSIPDNELVLLESYPRMFRARPLSFIGCIIISPALIGLVVLCVWWLRCKDKKLTITHRRSTLTSGIFSKSTNHVLHSHVSNIQIYQTFVERLCNVGKISISSSAQGDIEMSVAGIYDPYAVQRIIEQYISK